MASTWFARGLCVLTVFLSGLSGGTSVAVNMTCPSHLIEEEVNSVTCRIDTTAISNAGCVTPPTSLLFQIKGQASPLCISPYTSSCNACSDSIAEGGCGCTEQTGNVKTYIFKFKGTAKEYNGAKLECKVCAAVPEITIPASNCDSLNYVTQVPTCESLTKYVAVGLGVLLALLVAAIVIHVVFCRPVIVEPSTNSGTADQHAPANAKVETPTGELSKEAAGLRDDFRIVADRLDKHQAEINMTKLVADTVAVAGGACSLLSRTLPPDEARFGIATGNIFLAGGIAVSEAAEVAKTVLEDYEITGINKKWNAFRQKVDSLEETTESQELKHVVESLNGIAVLAITLLRLYSAVMKFQAEVNDDHAGTSLSLDAKVVLGFNVLSILSSFNGFLDMLAEEKSGDKSAMAAVVRNLAYKLDEIAQRNI